MNFFPHTALGERPFRNFVSSAFKTFLGFSVLAILTHISWNMFAPELFGLPQAGMKGAMGLVLFAATLSWVLGRGWGRRHGDASER